MQAACRTYRSWSITHNCPRAHPDVGYALFLKPLAVVLKTLEQSTAKGSRGRSKRQVDPVCKIRVPYDFAIWTQPSHGDPHKVSFIQIALNRPQRQPSPAKPRLDHRMLRGLVGHMPCSRR